MTRLRALLVFVVVVVLTGAHEAPVSAAPARVNGSGSTYVALAMQQWVSDAQTQGLQVNYLPTGSPDGLTSFANGLTDFAGTEAEFSALGSGGIGDKRGYQYVPDVAGAIAVMYNVEDKAGRKVDYLHLSMRTIARIFTGEISKWSDPAITADNPIGDGRYLELPDQPITVIYRGGQSGTTALFYDFVQYVAPDVFNPWAQKNRLPTNVRIIQLDGTPNFAPKTLALPGSDVIAQTVAGSTGKWAIAYDEFGYAKTYEAPVAWVQNASGNWVLPFAQNISAALETATLRPDLSQELSGVYSSPNPEAYPISAYSYIVTQCAPTPDRATCKGAYPNSGVTETLAKWMRYIACEGQVNMAKIGYSPLPPNLSQEIVNSVARMQGGTPEQLNAGNCVNPRFRGSLGRDAGSPPDPLAKPLAEQGTGGGSSGGGSVGSNTTGATGATTSTVPGTSESGGSKSVAAGTNRLGTPELTRDPDPKQDRRGRLQGMPILLLICLLAVIGVPLVVGTPGNLPVRVPGRGRPSARP